MTPETYIVGSVIVSVIITTLLYVLGNNTSDDPLSNPSSAATLNGSNAYELPVSEQFAYALASLCAATYVNNGIRLMASGEEDPASVDDVRKEFTEKLKKGFDRLHWSLPQDDALSLLRHHRSSRKFVRLGGFAVETNEYVALAFRGTAYSDEWMANISYALPAVRSWRQLIGLVIISLFPILKERRALRKVFELDRGANENAAYLVHLIGMVRQVKRFLDSVIERERAAPELRSRPLFITGHSLGGAASIITRSRLLSSRQQRYAKAFQKRMVTVTFGAPPILAEPATLEPSAPPIYNVVRPDDVVPCLSLDLIRIPILKNWRVVPEVPSTPYHFGEHFLLHVNNKVHAVKRYSLNHLDVFRCAAVQFLKGIFTINPFRRVAACHAMGSYAKDMAMCVFRNKDSQTDPNGTR